MSPLSFQVRVGIPGSLTIEIDPFTGLVGRQPAIFPPLNQPVLDAGPFGNARNQPPSAGVGLMGKAWAQGWVTPVSRRLVSLGGNTQFQLLSFVCPSLDQTDNAWGFNGDIDATSDPAQIINLTQFGTSNFGRSLAVGDYILWDDPSIANGMYQYEIDVVTSLGPFTVQRRGPGAAAGRAQFDSVKAAHSGVNFYQLITPAFNVLWDGSRQVFKFLWDNMIVSAVSGVTIGMRTPDTVNLFPVPPTPPTPGLFI